MTSPSLPSKGEGNSASSKTPIGLHPTKWHARLAARLIQGYILLVASSVRWRFVDQCGILERLPEERMLYCVWHNRLSLALILYRNVVQRRDPNRRMAALTSASKDGNLLARILEVFGVEPARGSSSRRGAQGFMEMARFARRGLDIAITPDGPRGPCYHLEPGVVTLARVTGLPIFPVSYHLQWKWTVKSWDRFQIPIPFTKCTVTLGRWYRVPKSASGEALETLRQEIEASMREITHDE